MSSLAHSPEGQASPLLWQKNDKNLSRGGAEEESEVEEDDGSPKGLPLELDEDPVDGLPDAENEFAAPLALTVVGRNTAEMELRSANKSSEFLRNCTYASLLR